MSGASGARCAPPSDPAAALMAGRCGPMRANPCYSVALRVAAATPPAADAHCGCTEPGADADQEQPGKLPAQLERDTGIARQYNPASRRQAGAEGGGPGNRVAQQRHGPGWGQSAGQSSAGPDCVGVDTDAATSDQGSHKVRRGRPNGRRTRDLPVDTAGQSAVDEVHCCGVPNREVAPDLEDLSLIHISEPTRLGMISYAV